MINTLDKKPIVEKMEELCSSLLQQDAYQELRKMIDCFAENDQAIEKYEHYLALHQIIDQKKMQGIEITEVEVQAFEEEEGEMYKDDVIRQFLFAQREFSQLHSLVSQYFTKTVELNRLPEHNELKKGGCGCGGNCSGGH
ncbi:YlbF family regulator [Paenibacillus sp. CMAA1364]